MADMAPMDLIAIYAVMFVVTALGTYCGSYLKKKGENLATHEDIDKLVTQVAAVTTATKQIEAKINRASQVYERQVDMLMNLYRHFSEAQAYLQCMASIVRFEGEVSEDQYRRLYADAIASARDTFLNGRLLIPPNLTQQCDRFFNALFQGQMHLAFAQYPMIVDGLERADLWDKAKKTAYEEVPSILQQIEKTARNVIHGEPLTI